MMARSSSRCARSAPVGSSSSAPTWQRTSSAAGRARLASGRGCSRRTPRLEQFFGGQFPVRQEMENAMSGALEHAPRARRAAAELLLVVIVAYILLIGPISYFVLRRIDRRELAWVTAPILVVLFTACSYGIGRTMKGGDVIVNEISVVRDDIGGRLRDRRHVLRDRLARSKHLRPDRRGRCADRPAAAPGWPAAPGQ